MRKLRLPCDMCRALNPDSGKMESRGKIWLSGNDYLECPQCFGEKTFECVEMRVQARVQTVFAGNMRPFTVMHLPPRAQISDTLIPRRI